ncbi:MAG: SMP-30/gluconolactonase/LRE family protein [Alphaproteobacteria bacterium]
MTRWVSVLGLLAALTGCDEADGERAARVELAPAWELTGFKQPESVVLEPGEGVLYVSNVDGPAGEKDGRGFISKVSLDGRLIERVWLDGLNAPKGLAVASGKLYVSDIDALVEVDLADKSTTRYEAPQARFLNDVTVDAAGNVYVSDMMDDAIYRLTGDSFGLWLRDEALEAPNGLLAEDGRIVVGSWGVITEGFATEAPGHLKTVSIAERSVASLGDGTPVGNLDGVEADGRGNYFVTDWMAGALLQVAPSGEAVLLLDLDQGSADHEYVAGEGLIVIPMMNDGKLVAYRVN